MLSSRFGIEIEFTGITRDEATRIVERYTKSKGDNRRWTITRDGSINCQKRVNGKVVDADDRYSVELVSPILRYREDIEELQGLVRELRKSGSFTNNSCGLHIHLDGSNHTARSIKNFVNIIASKGDLLYKALRINPERMRFCKALDAYMVEQMNQRKVKTLKQIEDIWYQGYHEERGRHFHRSRYHLCNLHSFFTGNHTVELRAFEGTLHAGEIRSYIVLALALNHQALTLRSASPRKPQNQNERFAMRTFLVRLGLNGKEFENCRAHLSAHLDGSAAWRFRAA